MRKAVTSTVEVHNHIVEWCISAGFPAQVELRLSHLGSCRAQRIVLAFVRANLWVWLDRDLGMIIARSGTLILLRVRRNISYQELAQN
jgi:hypothetical protein